MKLAALLIMLFSVVFSTYDCTTIKNGTFYFYTPDSSESFQLIRKDSLQEEISMKTFDTSFWRIIWMNDCTARVHLIRTTRNMGDDEKAFIFSHTTVMHILSVSTKYYIFEAGLDSLNSQFRATDTVWFNKK